MAFRSQPIGVTAKQDTYNSPRVRPPGMATIVIGFIAGLSSGFLGIGGGVFLVPALVFFIGLSEHQAHATSIATIVPTTLTSALVYATNKFLDVALSTKLAIGGVAGGYLGARLMRFCPPLLLRRFYAVFIAAISLKMILGK